MRCDDLVFKLTPLTIRVRYRTRGRVVEVAASAQLSAVQQGRASMPPADSTEGCAAHGPISTARKKEYGGDSTSLIYVYSSRQGQERAPSPPRVVRFLGASHKRRMGAKGALTEHPPGAGAPTGHPPGGYSESLVVHFLFLFFFEGNKVGPRTSSGTCSGLKEKLFAR